MEADTTKAPVQQRPHHRRNASSKSNILKSLVSHKSRAGDEETGQSNSNMKSRTQTVPLLPPDHPHAAKSKALGERQGNIQSPPSSPSKIRQKSMAVSKTSHDLRPTQSPKRADRKTVDAPKKSKSSTNLTSMFGKMNRSSKDLSATEPKDKENTTPPTSSTGPMNTPIWAQYASTNQPSSRPSTRDSKASDHIHDEIATYTPSVYSPSKQRNFDGNMEQPQLRPTPASRPQSMYVLGADIGAMARRLSGDRTNMAGRKSEDLERRKSRDVEQRVSGEKSTFFKLRQTSASSNEQAPAKEKLNITKRGGRVMAAVAALQNKGRDETAKDKQEVPLDVKAVDHAFEAVLDSRNIPEAMRQKMRSLTLRVKADFVKQDQEASKTVGSSPPTSAGILTSQPQATTKPLTSSPTEQCKTDDDSKSTKRSRARSRTFTFSKSDKRTDGSPSKKQRSQSKTRSTSTHDNTSKSPSTPTTPRTSMDKKTVGKASVPGDFLAYLKKNQDPVTVEVGRLHKLRILLRNETVAWVDSFVSLGGMAEIVGLLHRIMGVEWREEHEDQLLHETLLCLKGLCTTERAMAELEKVADELFPALLAMLFDDEKKGPAEYGTRTIITTVLFNFLASTINSSSAALETRTRRILSYLSDPAKPEDAKPVGFVLDMRTSRPYKLWGRELTHVTKEVFWIFLHHLNVVPLPKDKSELSPTDSVVETDAQERAKVLAATYTHRHFPGTRPPVPAAPYIGGVEWDATTYLTSHLDLLNGLIASIPSVEARNNLRGELQASGFEKVLGGTLRTCKEKFYSGVHDGLRAWVAAAAEDGWETRFVREGPTQEETLASCYNSPKKNPVKKKEMEKDKAPKLDLNIGQNLNGGNDNADDGWLG